MEMLYKLKEMLMYELEEIGEKNDIGAGDLELLHKLTDTIKNIDKICMLEEEEGGYSQDGGYSQNGNYSQAGNWSADMRGTYGHGNSYARGGRGGNRRGRNQYSRDGGYSQRRGYSRDGLKEQIERMMHEAGSEKEREALRRCMESL